MPPGLGVSENALIRSVCKDSFYSFVREFWGEVIPEKPVWNWHIEYFCALRQVAAERVFVGKRRRWDYIINVPPGTTKALEVSTPVLTTHGWKGHGSLTSGDFVYGPDGQPKRVLAVTPHQKQKSSSVIFKRAENSIIAANTHLWAVSNNDENLVKRTDELHTGSRPDSVEVNEPLDFPPQFQLVDPYILGMWLGDGDSDTGSIYVCEEDKNMVSSYGRLGHTVQPIEDKNGIMGQAFHRYVIEGLSKKLSGLGLRHNKHIPENYLCGSIKQRVALLQGLMDTDGSCDKSGECKFCNKNEKIIDGVKFLLNSLGLLYYEKIYTVVSPLSGKVCGPYHDLYFRARVGFSPFRLERKRKRTKHGTVRSRRRYLKGVLPIGEKTVNCISVEGELYLAGKDLVTTHNSTIFSIMFMPWVWTRMPSARSINASYTLPLAVNLSIKSRDIVRSDKYRECFPEVIIRSDQDSKTFFMNTEGGSRLCVGAGSSVVGMHGHFLDVDDPIDPESTASKEELNSVNRWMSETLPSRKIDKEVTVTTLIMQRLAENDPTGFLLAKGREDVKHICLPAEVSADIKPAHLVNRYVDGLLDSVRLSRYALKNQFANLGDYGYACQFQQTPIPRGGGAFHTDKITIAEAPNEKTDLLRTTRFWDKAATGGGGAFTVGLKMAIDKDGRFWVLDIVRVQLDSSRREALIKQTAQMDGVGVKIMIEQEPGSGGKESAEATIRNLAGFFVMKDRPQGKKELRADPYSTQVNGGNVYMVPAPWNAEYINELKFFPYGKYADQVDSSSGAFADLSVPNIVCGTF